MYAIIIMTTAECVSVYSTHRHLSILYVHCMCAKYMIQEWIGTYNASKSNEAYICYTKSWLNDYKETQLSPLSEPCPP